MGGAASSLAVRVRCGRGGAGGAPGTVRGGRLSKSVAKALCDRIDREQNRGISTILLARPGPMGAFATDLDNRPPRTVPGAPPAPRVRLLVWWQFPRALGVEGARRPGRAAGIVGALFFDQDSQGVHLRCPPRTSGPCPR